MHLKFHWPILPLLLLSFVLWHAPLAAASDQFTENSLETEVRFLAGRMGVPGDKIYQLVDSLKAAMAHPWFRSESKVRPVRGVMVFQSSEGGLIVKYMEGSGLVVFAPGGPSKVINLKAWSVGAQAGGSRTYGVGLFMGLASPDLWAGEYSGNVRGATAAEYSTKGGTVWSKYDSQGLLQHHLYLATSGTGLSAGVGKGKLTIYP